MIRGGEANENEMVRNEEVKQGKDETGRGKTVRISHSPFSVSSLSL